MPDLSSDSVQGSSQSGSLQLNVKATRDHEIDFEDVDAGNFQAEPDYAIDDYDTTSEDDRHTSIASDGEIEDELDERYDNPAGGTYSDPDNDGSDADEEMDEEFSTPEMSSQCETHFGASKENVI